MLSSAAILAGGRATRFGGRDKGALLVDGRAIRERQLDALRAITSDIVIVGGPDPKAAGTRHVADLATGCGPIGGLYTALLEAAHDQTIVIACDMPFVTDPFLRFLADALGDADAAVPRTARGLHPLCAVYARRTVDAVADRIRAGRLKMTDLFEDVRVRIVDANAMRAFGDPDHLLANVNTPAEHAGLEPLKNHEA